MFNFKSSITASIILFGLTTTLVEACTAKQKVMEQNQNEAGNTQSQPQHGSAEIVSSDQQGRKAKMNILAEGSYGQTSAPFIGVARGTRVYSILREMVKELPALPDDFFKSHAVVAVFLGTRNTGGHAVEITEGSEGQLLVKEIAPPANAITLQVITSPFKVVSVPLKEREGIDISLQGGLAANTLRPYRITAGEITSQGRAQNRTDKLGLGGELKLARNESLVTVFFDIKSVGAKRPTALRAAVTGVIDARGEFSLAGLNTQALTEGAASALIVAGQLSGDDNKLQLSLESASGVGATGVSGKLTAQATGPALTVTKPGESVY